MIKNPYPGQFITVEGCDGSGKTTQIEILQKELEQYGLNLVFTKEPTNEKSGWEIYDLLNNRHKTLKLSEMSGLEVQRLYFTNRRDQYRNVVLPCLRGGVNVVSDRGLVSVVFGIKDKDDIERFLAIEKAMFEAKKVPFVVPDLNLIYLPDPEVAFRRLKEKNRELDQFETVENIAKVSERYRWAAEVIPNCVVIDSNSGPEEVFKKTRKHVFRLLGIN